VAVVAATGLLGFAACTPADGPGSLSCSATISIAVPTSSVEAQSNISVGTPVRAVLFKNGTKVGEVNLTVSAAGSLRADLPTPTISSQPRHWRGEIFVNDVLVCAAEADTGTPSS
jgi:hypothetical protein